MSQTRTRASEGGRFSTQTAERLRQFNRYYTEAIGSLDDRHEGLDVSFVQSRLLYTIARCETPNVGELASRLSLDVAHASRVLGTLEDQALIQRRISQHDRRERVVTLTSDGRELLSEIERRSNARMPELISHLKDSRVDELLAATETIIRLLDRDTKTTETSREETDGQ